MSIYKGDTLIAGGGTAYSAFEPYVNSTITERLNEVTQNMVVFDKILDSNQHTVTIPNIDLSKGPYTIEIDGKSTEDTDVGLTLTNVNPSNYWQMGQYFIGAFGDSEQNNLSYTRGFRPGKTSWYYAQSLRPFPTKIEAQLEKSQLSDDSLGTVRYMWTTKCVWSSKQVDANCFGVVTGLSNNIVSLTYTCHASSANFMAGTRFTVRRKYAPVVTGRSTSAPIDEIVAGLQSQLSGMTPVVLYNDSTGTNGTITLTQSINNFTRLKIYTRSNDDLIHGYEIYTGFNNSVKADLTQHNFVTNSTCYLKSKWISITGTKLTVGGYGELSINTSGVIHSNKDYLYITRIEGYRY